MPRYFFHVRDGSTLTEDRQGMELPDVEAARKHATKAACRIWSETPPTSTSNDETFEVTDERGAVVVRVSFSEAFAERAAT
jgi:hypothetical protein